MPLLDRLEQGLRGQGVVDGAAVAIDLGVLLRLAPVDVLDADAGPLGPTQLCAADVLRAVVAADRSGLAAPLGDPFERPDHARRGQGEVGSHSKVLPAEVVDHVERAEAVPVAELVVHEVD